MGRFRSFCFTCFLCYPVSLQAQSPTANPALITAVRSTRMLDVTSGQYLSDAVILIQNGKIAEVGSGLTVPAGAKVAPCRPGAGIQRCRSDPAASMRL
jgi:hypothetical protein